MAGFFAVLFIVLAAGAGAVLFLMFRKNRPAKAGGTVRKVSVLVCVVVAGLSFAGLVFVPAGFVTVNTGEVAVVKKWGEVIEVKSAGLHFRNVISTEYIIYDTKTQQIDANVFAYSLDGQTLTVEMSTQLSVRSDKLIEVATVYGSLEMLKDRVSKVVEEKVKVVMSGKSAMEIIATRNTLSPTVLTELKTLEAQYFMTVDNFVVADIEFEEAFEKAVEAKMIAEQDKLKAQYDKEKAVIKAEEQAEVIRLEAEARAIAAIEDAKAAVTKAGSEAAVIELKAKAQADAEKIMAEAQAEALRVLSEQWATMDDATKRATLQAQFYAKWDGKLPEVMSDGMNILWSPSPITP